MLAIGIEHGVEEPRFSVLIGFAAGEPSCLAGVPDLQVPTCVWLGSRQLNYQCSKHVVLLLGVLMRLEMAASLVEDNVVKGSFGLVCRSKAKVAFYRFRNKVLNSRIPCGPKVNLICCKGASIANGSVDNSVHPFAKGSNLAFLLQKLQLFFRNLCDHESVLIARCQYRHCNFLNSVDGQIGVEWKHSLWHNAASAERHVGDRFVFHQALSNKFSICRPLLWGGI